MKVMIRQNENEMSKLLAGLLNSRDRLARSFALKLSRYEQDLVGNEEKGDKQWPWPGQSPHSEACPIQSTMIKVLYPKL